VSAAGCLFCKIVAGEIPATRVHEDAACVAFRDNNPQAPTHVLIVPRVHVASVSDLRPEHDATLGAMFRAAATSAAQEGLAARGWRTVFNVGADAGQTVLHLHLHLLGGRPLGWPPG
jgi:histidine triad (HIT) family protein